MSITILTGDALEQLRTLPDASVHCCVTSPPYYGLRDYGMAGQIGQEYNVETWGLHSRLAAIDAALSSLDRTTLPAAEGEKA